MSVVEVQIDIDAPRDAVWRVVADPRNLPRWDKRIESVEDVPAEVLRTGSSYTVVVRFMGVRAHVRADALEIREPEYSRVHLHGMIDATVVSTLESLDDRRTRLLHHIEYRFVGGPLGDLAATAAQLLGGGTLLRRGVEAQRRQVEEG